MPPSACRPWPPTPFLGPRSLYCSPTSKVRLSVITTVTVISWFLMAVLRSQQRGLSPSICLCLVFHTSATSQANQSNLLPLKAAVCCPSPIICYAISMLTCSWPPTAASLAPRYPYLRLHTHVQGGRAAAGDGVAQFAVLPVRLYVGRVRRIQGEQGNMGEPANAHSQLCTQCMSAFRSRP